MTNNKPTHYAYVVTGDGEKKSWTRVGAAWSNRDGDGLNIVLEAIPVSGRLTLRVSSVRDLSEGGAQ